MKQALARAADVHGRNARSVAHCVVPALAALLTCPALVHARQAAASPGEPSAAPAKSLWDYVLAGGSIGFLIIGLSIVALALVIIQFVRLRVDRLAPPGVVQGIAARLSENDAPGAIKFCDEAGDVFLARTFGAALTRCSRSPFGFLELRTALEEAGGAEVVRVGRPTEYIAVIASVAPMLGLLGTVVGMVLAFDTIGVSQGTAKPADLAAYISLALITTVQGLVVAIPCTAAVAYFRSRLEQASGDVAQVAEGLAADFEAAAGVRTAQQRPAQARPMTAGAAARPGPAGGAGAGVGGGGGTAR